MSEFVVKFDLDRALKRLNWCLTDEKNMVLTLIVTSKLGSDHM